MNAINSYAIVGEKTSLAFFIFVPGHLWVTLLYSGHLWMTLFFSDPFSAVRFDLSRYTFRYPGMQFLLPYEKPELASYFITRTYLQSETYLQYYIQDNISWIQD